jgi:hypothetical protein
MSRVQQVLQNRFSHPRDKYMRYYEKFHKYENTKDLQNKYISVTTWVPKHFSKFDADAVIEKIFNSKSWQPGHKYWGMTAEDIKNSWKNLGKESANSGTQLHSRIEDFMNDNRLSFEYTQKELYEIYRNQYKNPDESLEWNYFLEFVSDNPDLKPYRTEWKIYDEDLKIAGAIDMVYENPDGTLSIYDWKRCKDIPQVSEYGNFATNPLISHLHDTKFWHYALQLNTYKTILERKYGKVVTKLCLIQLHPESYNGSYQEIDVPILTEEINSLFEERLKEVCRN